MRISFPSVPRDAESAIVVDVKGLANQVAGRPKVFILYELVQNALDEVASGATEVHVDVERPKSGMCSIRVQDDGPGFRDLRSAYEMFRRSYKADNPELRGRFEIGEKLVIALMVQGFIMTTTGSVYFQGGRRWKGRTKTERGTIFNGTFRITRAEHDEMLESFRRIIVPEGVTLVLNGRKLERREPVCSFRASLPTVIAGEDGTLKPSTRQTTVDVYRLLEGERSMVYEMGLPVVELCGGGDQWSFDVQQKVPVNWARDNLPPRFVSTLRVSALNALADQVTGEAAQETWVTEAIADPRCAPEALSAVLDERFGKKRVIYDPSDAEGTKLAMSKGYTVIPGRALPKGAWENVRQTGAALPAGQVTPGPKVYSPDGEPETVIPEEEWSSAMWRKAEFAEDLAVKLLQHECSVYIVREPRVSWAANFQSSKLLGRRLCLNYGVLGKKWFERSNDDEQVLGLLLHEFAHEFASDHLASAYHDGLSLLGAKLARLCLRSPAIFGTRQPGS